MLLGWTGDREPNVPSSLSDRLRALADPIWQAQHDHPFVLSIGDGSVDMARFAFWVRQDYLFLIDYARLFALGVARAPDVESMSAFARLCHETLSTEMALHRSYAAEFGITEADLESETRAPATQAYTDFLLRTAALGDYGELVAALLPCMWGFSEIGTSLRERGLPSQPQCAAWVEMYASPDFADLAAWCRRLLDQAAAGLPGPQLRRLESAFLTSSRHELAFWDMAQTHDADPRSA
jgi:thiaminase/transcriptional activator TenA